MAKFVYFSNEHGKLCILCIYEKRKSSHVPKLRIVHFITENIAVGFIRESDE